MNALFARLDGISTTWAEGMLRASWQGGLALGLAWILCRTVPRIPPRMQCWIWRLAHLKLLVALAWATPVDVPLLPPSPVPAVSTVIRQPVRTKKDVDMQPVVPRAYPIVIARQPRVGMTTWLLSFWICGVIWCSGRLLQDWRRTRSLRRTGIELDPQEAISQWAELARTIGLRRVPPILASDFIAGPLVLGTFQPAILLPTELCRSSCDEGLRLKLAHEFAHVSRRDLLWNGLPALVRILFFFHPLVWLAWREWQFAQEAACDELVLCRTGAAPVDYADMLVAASVLSGARPGAGLMAAGVLGSYQTLRRRLIVMKYVQQLSKWQLVLFAIVVASVGTLCLVPWRISESRRSGPVSTRSSLRELSAAVVNKRSFAEVRILGADSKKDLETYCQTQARLVKSPFILNAVLRNREIAESGLLKGQADPLKFLEARLEVDFPASEFMRISFAGERSPEAARIVNAVVDDYLSEVVNAENDVRNRRISELDKVHRDIEEQIRTRRNTLKRLLKYLQTSDPMALVEKQKMMIELGAALRKQRAQMQFELIHARVKLTALQEGGALNVEPAIPEAVVEARLAEDPRVRQAESDLSHSQKLVLQYEATGTEAGQTDFGTARKHLEIARKYLDLLKGNLQPTIFKQLQAESRARAQSSEAELRETIRVTELTIKQLDQELDKHTVETRQTGEWSLEAETLKDDLVQAKTIDQRVTTEIEQLKVELKTEPRVVKYRMAEPDAGRSAPQADMASPVRKPSSTRAGDAEKTER